MANTQDVRRRRIPGCRSGDNPYELAPPAANLQKWLALSAEERQRQEQSWSARKSACVSWAEDNGVCMARPGQGGEHPDWLLRATTRGDYRPRPRWIDHPLCWVRGRSPAAITASPYSYQRERLLQEIHEWLADKPGIGLAIGPGWYHDKTMQIVLWRRDVLGDGVTAADAGPDALRWLSVG